jgi:mono/diheme cytochrome c family protein
LIDQKKLLDLGLRFGPLAGMYGFFAFLILGFAGYGYYWVSAEVVPPQPIGYNHRLHVADPKGPGLSCIQCHQYTDKGRQAGAPPLLPSPEWNATWGAVEGKTAYDQAKKNGKSDADAEKASRMAMKAARLQKTGPVSCADCHGPDDPAELYTAAGDRGFWDQVSAKFESPEAKKVVDHIRTKRPVHWHRVHKMPTHLYFSHKRHIKALRERDEIKEIEGDREKIITMCRFCHGEVQMMGENRQVRSMEMGFCISCHKSRGAPTDCWTCHK